MHHKLNYVEFPSHNLNSSKAFFQLAFDWQFEDFGPEYTAFKNQGLDGGFYYSEEKLCSQTHTGGALLVFYSRDLEASQIQVEAAGGNICESIFSFPGGRRFHFTEPCGNEFAVWSDT